MVDFGEAQAAQFRLDVFELLETLLVEELALAAHRLGGAAVVGQAEGRRRDLALDLVLELQRGQRLLLEHAPNKENDRFSALRNQV